MSESGAMRSRGSASMALRVLLAVGFVIAAGATVLVVLAKDVQLLRLAAVLALWAALIAAFAVARSRRDAKAAALREKEAHLAYRVELHREVSARHEYEAQLAAQMADAQSQQIAELREQLDRLTEVLTALADGEVFVSRMTLSAESARFRAGQSLAAGAAPAAVMGDSARAIDWVAPAEPVAAMRAAADPAPAEALPAVTVPPVLVADEAPAGPAAVPMTSVAAPGPASVPSASASVPEAAEAVAKETESQPVAPATDPEAVALGPAPAAKPTMSAVEQVVSAVESTVSTVEPTVPRAEPAVPAAEPAPIAEAPPERAVLESAPEPVSVFDGFQRVEPAIAAQPEPAPVEPQSGPASVESQPEPAPSGRRSRHAVDDEGAGDDVPWWRRAVDEAVSAREAEAARPAAVAAAGAAADAAHIGGAPAAETQPRPLPTPEPAPEPFTPEPLPEPLPVPVPAPQPFPQPFPQPEPAPQPFPPAPSPDPVYPPAPDPEPWYPPAQQTAPAASYAPQTAPAADAAAAPSYAVPSYAPASAAGTPETSPEDLLAAYGLTSAPRRRRRD